VTPAKNKVEQIMPTTCMKEFEGSKVVVLPEFDADINILEANGKNI
jgi:hypothetical protein